MSVLTERIDAEEDNNAHDEELEGIVASSPMAVILSDHEEERVPSVRRGKGVLRSCVSRGDAPGPLVVEFTEWCMSAWPSPPTGVGAIFFLVCSNGIFVEREEASGASRWENVFADTEEESVFSPF